MKINGMLPYVALALCGAITAFAQTPPPNDNFANRTVLTGTDIAFSGTLAGATVENFVESLNFNSTVSSTATHSVWWTWTAPTNTMLTLQVVSQSPSVFTNDYLAQIGVYQATNTTVNDLVYPPLGYAPVVFRFLSQTLSIPVTAGSNYQIQLIGITSANYTFRLIATNTPVIIQQPISQTVSSNASALFYVVAAGADQTNFGFQWRLNGTNLPTENAPMLALTSIDSSNAGAYSVVVSNAAGYTISEPATLTVSTSNAPVSLAVAGVQSNLVKFSLLGEIGRTYRLQSSVDLITWSPEAIFPFAPEQPAGGPVTSLIFNSNAPTTVVVSNNLPAKFFRAVPYVTAGPDAEICINNLRQIQIAKLLWQRDFAPPFLGTPADGQLQPYFPHQTLIACPDDPYQILPISPANSYYSYDTSYNSQELFVTPQCMIDPVNHCLELRP